VPSWSTSRCLSAVELGQAVSALFSLRQMGDAPTRRAGEGTMPRSVDRKAEGEKGEGRPPIIPTLSAGERTGAGERPPVAQDKDSAVAEGKRPSVQEGGGNTRRLSVVAPPPVVALAARFALGVRRQEAEGDADRAELSRRRLEEERRILGGDVKSGVWCGLFRRGVRGDTREEGEGKGWLMFGS
jgi:hypothetical protein